MYFVLARLVILQSKVKVRGNRRRKGACKEGFISYENPEAWVGTSGGVKTSEVKGSQGCKSRGGQLE